MITNNLIELLKDFYNLTKMKVCIFDADGIEVCFYPEKFTKFCSLIRQNETIEKKCIECDRKAFSICKQTKMPYIYTCHAGLTECFAPIIINDDIQGFIGMGQIRENVDFKFNFSKHFDKEKLSKLYDELQIESKEKIKSALHILEACACYDKLKQYILNTQTTFNSKIEAIIKQNLKNDLSIDFLCKSMHTSRVELYRQIKEIYNLSPAKLIKKIRLEYSKELLLTTKKKVYVIAEDCGIGDYNYFSKLFKKHFNQSPNKFRQ